MAINDARISFRNLLIADATLLDLVSTRIHAAKAAGDNITFPYMTFHFSGGPLPVRAIEIQNWNVTLRAHSKDSYDEAHTIYDAARQALGFNEKAKGGTSKIIVVDHTDPSELFDEDADSYDVVGRIDIRHIEF